MPLADCHDPSRCAAAASCPLNDPPPPVCKHPLSRWLLCHPRCRAAAASCPFSTSSRRRLKCPSLTPTFTNASPPIGLLLPAGCRVTPVVALLPPLVLSAPRRASSSSAHPCTPVFIHTGWLLCLISLHCFRLPFSHQHRRLLMRWLLTSHPVCLSLAPTCCLCV